MSPDHLINDIEALFLREGGRPYDGRSDEPHTVLGHALHCAQLAEWAEADEALVAAALLQGLSPLLDGDGVSPDARQARLLALLESLGPAVTEPLRLQPQARRYVQAAEEGDALMSAAEQARFEAQEHAARAVQLCRLIEQAAGPSPRTPPLDYYLALLEDLQRQSADSEKLEVGPQTVT